MATMEGTSETPKETLGSKERERIRAEERNRLGNMFVATVALIRNRFVRFLQLLNASDPKMQTQLTLAITELYGFLLRRLRLNQTVRNSLLFRYPAFDPQKYYAKIIFDRQGREIRREQVENACPFELMYVRECWHITDVHGQLIQRWFETFEIYADEMFKLTGTAIIHQMEDFSKGAGIMAVDTSTARDIATGWGENGGNEE